MAAESKSRFGAVAFVAGWRVSYQLRIPHDAPDHHPPVDSSQNRGNEWAASAKAAAYT